MYFESYFPINIIHPHIASTEQNHSRFGIELQVLLLSIG
jgi:hypothetical protein